MRHEVADELGQTDSIVRLSINDVKPSTSCPRSVVENAEHTRVLAEAETELPPIVVHRETMEVIDGTHRLRAAVERGARTIDVRFFDGNPADAFVLAVKLNRAHGLPLTLAERTAAAARIVDTHPHWSDRRIANAVAIAASTVGEIRARSTVRNIQTNTRIGRDGRARRRDTTGGRELAGELIRQRPEASVREIAKAAGLSLATVSDVRARIRNGQPPSCSRQGESTGVRKQPRSAAPEPGTAAASHTTSTLERNEIMRNLKRDPSLRFTEAGRMLLRLLDCHVLSVHQERIAQSVPEHCKEMVVSIARDSAGAWHEFADVLARRESGPASQPS